MVGGTAPPAPLLPSATARPEGRGVSKVLVGAAAVAAAVEAAAEAAEATEATEAAKGAVAEAVAGEAVAGEVAGASAWLSIRPPSAVALA